MYKPLFQFKYDPCYDVEEKIKNIESQNYQFQSLEAPASSNYYKQPTYSHYPESKQNGIWWFFGAILTIVLCIIAYVKRDLIYSFLLDLKETINSKQQEELVLHIQEIEDSSLKQLEEPNLNP